MSVNIRYPNITASTPTEQLAQIRSYLHQLVEELNYALPLLGEGDGTGSTTSSYEVQGEDVSYYELRSLIIQELQEVEAMFDQLSAKMQSEYVSDEELPQAIDIALAQAKASGEFDGPKGEKGDPGEPGPQGPKGEDGTGVTILGSYDTVEELTAAHPTGNIGDSYLINGFLYVWSDTTSDWKNVGNIKGPQGEQGPQGDQGPPGEQGIQGVRGETGADGFSPVVSVTDIEGGHRVTITDKSSTQSFDVMDGANRQHFKLDDGTNLY